MNSKKNDNSNLDDDLKFMPLNLKEPFKSKDSSWAPYINLNIPTNYMTNNFFLPLPELQLAQGLNNPSNLNSINPLAPCCQNSSNPSNFQSKNSIENTKSNLNKNNITSNGELFPSETLEDELFSYNTSDINNPNNTPNRDLKDLVHLDILRDFDLSLDLDIKSENRLDSNENINKIFEDIKANNSGLIETLNSYRIPSPIATLVIKKIIKTTLNNYKGA